MSASATGMLSSNNHEESQMGMIRKTLFAAVAAKVFQEARKPENQRRIRDLIHSVRSSGTRRAR